MSFVEFAWSFMDRVLNENEIINDMIDDDFRRIQKTMPQEKYDYWSGIHSKVGRKHVNALLRKIGSGVLGLLWPSAQNGLTEGAYRDELRRMENRYEEQEIQLYWELQEMLLESIHHRNTKPYRERIIALANIRGKLYSVNHTSWYNKK